MPRIGLLSDTHSYLDPQVFKNTSITLMKYGMPEILAPLNSPTNLRLLNHSGAYMAILMMGSCTAGFPKG